MTDLEGSGDSAQLARERPPKWPPQEETSCPRYLAPGGIGRREGGGTVGRRVRDRIAERASSVPPPETGKNSPAYGPPNWTVRVPEDPHRNTTKIHRGEKRRRRRRHHRDPHSSAQERKTTTVEEINRPPLARTAVMKIRPRFHPFLWPIFLASRPWSQAKFTSSIPPTLLLWPYILSFFGTFDIGIPQTNQSKGNPELIAYAEPLFNIMPALAEHFYRGLHNPSIHPHTSDFVMRYIRTYENFSAHQLATLPFKVRVIPHSQRQGPVFRQFKSRHQRGSVESLTSFLRLQPYIFNLGVSELLELIYGSEQVKVIPAHKVEEEERWYLWWGSYTKGSR
ncbi:hypothetical protein H4582DRAFT_2052337 [Lactarius indigo]|nr:hypothetical protein H4582DRAFT_2052337 [Lactarius indigo]